MVKNNAKNAKVGENFTSYKGLVRVNSPDSSDIESTNDKMKFPSHSTYNECKLLNSYFRDLDNQK